MLRLTESVEESMAINRVSGGAIVIAGSGMCNGGRIVHHLKHNLWKSSNHLIFVGFQAYGTLGRRLVDGERRIRLFGQEIVVKAKVHTIGGFSAHAGQTELVRWATAIGGAPDFYLVHGEPEAQQVLQHQPGQNRRDRRCSTRGAMAVRHLTCQDGPSKGQLRVMCVRRDARTAPIRQCVR